MASPIEVGSVVDCCLIRRRAAKNGWLPSVEMAGLPVSWMLCIIESKVVPIKMNDANRAIGRVDRSKDGQYDGVVSAECDDPWVMLSIFRDWDEGLAGDRIVPQRRESRPLEQ